MHKMQNMWVSNYRLFRWAFARQSNWIQLASAIRHRVVRYHGATTARSTFLHFYHTLDGFGGEVRRFLLSAKRLYNTGSKRRLSHLTTATDIPLNIMTRGQKWNTATYAEAWCGRGRSVELSECPHNCRLCSVYKGTLVGHTTLSNSNFFLLWRCDPTRVMASPFLRFLDRTRRTTVGRTPVDEWSARRRDLYLTTYNRQTSMPPVRFEPTISAGEWPQTYALDRAATGTGYRVELKYLIFPTAFQSD